MWSNSGFHLGCHLGCHLGWHLDCHLDCRSDFHLDNRCYLDSRCSDLGDCSGIRCYSGSLHCSGNHHHRRYCPEPGSKLSDHCRRNRKAIALEWWSLVSCAVLDIGRAAHSSRARSGRSSSWFGSTSSGCSCPPGCLRSRCGCWCSSYCYDRHCCCHRRENELQTEVSFIINIWNSQFNTSQGPCKLTIRTNRTYFVS